MKLRKLEQSITNRKRNENTDMHEKVNNCATNEEDAVEVVQEFEEILKT